MLFNSYEFVFIFFPVVFIGFFLIAKKNHSYAEIFLALASLCFYGWWSLQALPLLLGSIVFNYLIGKKLRGGSVYVFYFGLIANLAVLGFFKYADFFVSNINYMFDSMGIRRIAALNIILPIGISFYTFTQIAFLVDCWKGKVKEQFFFRYLLFVTYFPHLIAGPIIHHAQIMSQFANSQIYRVDYKKLSIAIIFVVIGMAKKILLADPLGESSDILFGVAREGVAPSMIMSWLGVLAYTFQIYFDFSGYSDMAIGISLALGIYLPINFNSPYQATNIIDFWRRWHISLSVFLRDYLYIPLGGNRFGNFRRYINLFITMLLGGLWHGANWTFVLWGAAHGLFLIINHRCESFFSGKLAFQSCWWIFFSRVITFLAVASAWVLFRADNLSAAITIYEGMLGFGGKTEGAFFHGFLADARRLSPDGPIWLVGTIFIAALIAFFAPNLNGLLHSARNSSIVQKLTHWGFAPVFAGIFFLCILRFAKNSPFLYFQF
ncbi:MBOAT family O-acyltransferase [Herbaspirillum autotrophicum]|uniref:MBOAT family O-acyltransferase n=1 Tax=Herbaspirillum autotrophicum TaxID=180195 RepID=UPI00067C306C|nr:MBOAT family O-acyltransferase [Herbaspirillum autotrophicum]